MTVLSWLAALVLAIASGGGLAALVLVPRQRRRLSAASSRDVAEAMQMLTATAASSIGELRKQLAEMDAMRQQLFLLRRQLDEAEAKVAALIADLDAANARTRYAEAEVTRLRADGT
jgi:hypothetical protein